VSETFEKIRKLVNQKEVLISSHGYEEVTYDRIALRDILAGVNEAVVVEDYPEYPKGSCVLVLQRDAREDPIHVVWGIPRGKSSPAVLVTAYRPDPNLWSADFLRRLS
jgi:hypothetical protein